MPNTLESGKYVSLIGNFSLGAARSLHGYLMCLRVQGTLGKPKDVRVSINNTGDNPDLLNYWNNDTQLLDQAQQWIAAKEQRTNSPYVCRARVTDRERFEQDLPLLRQAFGSCLEIQVYEHPQPPLLPGMEGKEVENPFPETAETARPHC